MPIFRYPCSVDGACDKTLPFSQQHHPYPLVDGPRKPVPSLVAETAGAVGPVPTRKRPRESEVIAIPVDSPRSPLTKATTEVTEFRKAKTKRPKIEGCSCSHDNVSSAEEGQAQIQAQIQAHMQAEAKVEAARTSISSQSQPTMTRQAGSPQVSRTHVARDMIDHEFSVSILTKHNELRLINQELAKCQVALEQLRRCHLIPYPVNTPTPEQMLNVTNGQGPSLLPAKSGEKIPQWAPPFGVTDGPYVRHYAKWLIPDAKFDGIQPPALMHPANSESGWSRNSAQSTRSMASASLQSKSRPTRGLSNLSSLKPQSSLSTVSSYPQSKEKASRSCILKRNADGKMVKLVCCVCHRDNFSNTQGFINHCRIAHKKDFKSHEEAAIACGHALEVEGGNDERTSFNAIKTPTNSTATATTIPSLPPLPPPPPSTTTTAATTTTMTMMTPTLPAHSSGLVHPLASENALARSEACFAVVARINESIAVYHRGQFPGFSSASRVPIPDVTETSTNNPHSTTHVSHDRQDRYGGPDDLTLSSEPPHLSRLLSKRGMSLDLAELVRDAKTSVDFDDVMSSAGESDDGVDGANEADGHVHVNVTHIGSYQVDQTLPLEPGMRLPSRNAPPPICRLASTKPSSRNTPTPRSLAPMVSVTTMTSHDAEPMDDEIDVDLNANVTIANKPPSLVSDDGMDESLDGSSADESDASEKHGGHKNHVNHVNLDVESISDITEVAIDDDHVGPRTIRHHHPEPTGVSNGTNDTKGRQRQEDHGRVSFLKSVNGRGRQKKPSKHETPSMTE